VNEISAPPASSVAGPSKPRLWQVLGPGLITGAADDDPSGIATYAQAGAQFGFRLGWTLLLTFPLMVVIQAISARIGRTTGHGIAGTLRTHYPQHGHLRDRIYSYHFKERLQKAWPKRLRRV
jgi:NRAMP (natural resistance-associated macrophage protein)-like metal ion transporter